MFALKTGAQAAQVAQNLIDESNQFILAKDLHNLYKPKETSKTTQEKLLKQTIDQIIAQDGGNNYIHFIQNESKTELYAIFYQSTRMKNLFKTYGTILFIDGTYKLNKNNYPVIIFIVTDNNRASRIVGFAIIAYERMNIINTLLEMFAELNETSIIKYCMIDKDLKEDAALTNVFPNAKILYCFWHVEKIFMKNYKQQNQLDLLKQMMLVTSAIEFEIKKKEFEVIDTNKDYMNDNWYNCIEKWTRHTRIGLPTNIQETNTPVEVINHQVKLHSEKHASNPMYECLKKIITYIRSSETKKLIIAVNKADSTLCNQNYSADHVVNQFYKYVATKIADWLKNEYESSLSRNYELIDITN